MMTFLRKLSLQRRYWIGLIVIGLSLEAAALFYQYIMDEWPCVLCIHIRIWIAAFIVISLIALAGHRFIMLTRFMHFLTVISMAGFLERSWQVLGVERGWIFGDCDMDLGMPSWFALDKWIPSVFEVQTSCGYTPILLLNITMAEVLMVVSALLLLLSFFVFVFSCIADPE